MVNSNIVRSIHRELGSLCVEVTLMGKIYLLDQLCTRKKLVVGRFFYFVLKYT